MFERALLSLAEAILLLVRASDLRIVAANPAALNALGYDEATLLKLDITDIESALQDLFFWQEVGSGSRPDNIIAESLYRCANGDTLSVERRLNTLILEGEEYIGISARSVNEEKVIAENLERTAAVLRATFESTSYGILVTDLHDNAVNLNRRFSEIWQLDVQALQAADTTSFLRRLLRRVKHPAKARLWLATLADTREHETLDEMILRNNHVIRIRSHAQLSQGHVIGRVFTFEDITDQVHAHEELEHAREQAERANRAKTEFLRHMSHELRTPLNAIIGFARLGLEPGETPQREHMEMIARAGDHLLGLINEVLDLAAVEAGRIPLAFISVPLHTLISDAIYLVQPLADQYKVTLHASTDSPLWVRADQTRLRQMLLNLLSNAIKYNRENGQARVHYRIENRLVYIDVIDTGIGIDENDQRLLFENFSRVGSKIGQVEGTGIGLAFSRKLARLMQGDIYLRSNAGTGSTFTIELPLADNPVNDVRVPVNTSQTENMPCTILYIEDDAVSRKLMQAIIKKHASFTLWLAENGATGLNMAEQHLPDIILTDMHLGDMTGHDVMKKLREVPALKNTPMVMISAGVMKDEVESALQAGFTRYLTKPVHAPTLIATIQQLQNRSD